MTRILLTVIAMMALAPTLSASEVYRWVMPDGSVVFSDEPPPEDAAEKVEEIDVKPVQTVPAIGPRPTGKTSDKPEDPTQAENKPFKYTRFAIVSPENDSAFRSNDGSITVSLAVEPGLNTTEGHQISVSLDGKPVAGPTTSTSVTIPNVDRGSHTVSASIQDATGKKIKTATPTTFHLQRHSVR